MPNEEMRNKTIGNLNGRWATFFQALMIIMPIIVPMTVAHATWLTKMVFENREMISVQREAQRNSDKLIKELTEALNKLQEDLKYWERTRNEP